MVAIKLPDGSVLDMESGVNGFDIANKISANYTIIIDFYWKIYYNNASTFQERPGVQYR